MIFIWIFLFRKETKLKIKNFLYIIDNRKLITEKIILTLLILKELNLKYVILNLIYYIN